MKRTILQALLAGAAIATVAAMGGGASKGSSVPAAGGMPPAIEDKTVKTNSETAMFTEHSTWKQIEDARPRTAVVTIGATEQHGHHLPLSTDTLITEEFARVVARELNAYLTPTIPIGQSEMWNEYPGTLWLSEGTLKAVMTDVADALVKTGFTTILFVSMHGGNEAVYRGFPESLQARHPGVRILTAGYPFWVRDNWANLWKQALKRAGLPEIMHADEVETSLILALRPELVGAHPVDQPYRGYGKSMRQLYPSGSMGYGSRASREKGQRLWKELLELALADLRKQLQTAP